MTPARARLPNRRPSHVETLEVGGQVITACVGFDPATGQPREVFLNGDTAGSQVDALVADAATVISVALQFGVPVAALAKSVGRVPSAPATPWMSRGTWAGNTSGRKASAAGGSTS